MIDKIKLAHSLIMFIRKAAASFLIECTLQCAAGFNESVIYLSGANQLPPYRNCFLEITV